MADDALSIKDRSFSPYFPPHYCSAFSVSSPEKGKVVYANMTNICTTAELIEYIQKVETDKDALGLFGN